MSETYVVVILIVVWATSLINLGFTLLLARSVSQAFTQLQKRPASTVRGPAIGELAPILNGHDPTGAQKSILLGQERPSLLLFTSPHCKTCQTIVPSLNAVVSRFPELLLIIVSIENDRIASHGSPNVDHIISAEARVSYGIAHTPYSFAVDGQGIVQSRGIVTNVSDLINQAVAAFESHPATA